MMIKHEDCADTDPHERHLWGYPTRKCWGVGPQQAQSPRRHQPQTKTGRPSGSARPRGA